MNVLHVVTRHLRGGSERNLVHTIDWQLRHAHTVHVAVGPRSHVEDFPHSVRVHELNHLKREISPLEDALAYKELVELIVRNRFDVVHTHQSKAGAIGRLAARGRCPCIVHTIHMASFGPGYTTLSSAGFRRVERLCGSFTSRFVAVGHELMTSYLSAGIGRADRYVVIRSPIEIDRFLALRGRDRDRRGARERLGLDTSVPVALAIGSLEPRKRHRLAIERLAPLLRVGRLQLLIAGDGSGLADLEANARELDVRNATFFAGYVDAVDAFAAADILVHSSTVEGVSQVVIQALAAGVPVIATEVEGLREVETSTIRIVARSGDGLARAVEDVLANSPSRAVPPVVLDPWRADRIEEGLATLHADLEVIAEAARGPRLRPVSIGGAAS